jgi:hypothetical protein
VDRIGGGEGIVSTYGFFSSQKWSFKRLRLLPDPLTTYDAGPYGYLLDLISIFALYLTLVQILQIMSGQKITISNGKLQVPDQPILPFIEGDGTGPDIWAASVRVFDASVERRTAASAKSSGWK